MSNNNQGQPDPLNLTGLDILLDSMPEATFFVDNQGIIRFFNKSYEKLLETNRKSVVGKHVLELQPNSNLEKVLRTGVAELENLMNIRGQDAVVQRLPIFNNGEIIGAIARVMFRNVSEAKDSLKRIGYLENKLGIYKQELKSVWSAKFDFDDIVGVSPAITEVKRLAKRIAGSDSTVLIRGESGVGKELFAHSIHKSSPRSDYPFIKVNCGAIPKDLVESELFGYEGGAFTGAKGAGKPGKFELAEKGTILLDEIGDMPMDVQVKLLRIIENKEIERVGGVKPINLNVRIIAATNCNLEEKIKTGKFREDLFFRINVVSLRVPLLRERPEDIEPLTLHLMEKISRERRLAVKTVRKDVFEVLQMYPWPGNIRELANLVEQLMNFVDNPEIKLEHLPPHIYNQSSEFGNCYAQLQSMVKKTEKDILLNALKQAEGNKKVAARMLGIHRSTLYEKLNKHGIG